MEGTWRQHTLGILSFPRIYVGRTLQDMIENILEPRKIYKDQKASVQTDEESESFDIQKGSKQGDPMSSLLFNTVLQYSFKKRNTTMAKEERNGNLLERPRTRLPNEPAICRRRDAVRNLQRTDTEYDVRIQESNRESGTQDPPRQDEDSQQPEHHQFEHKKTY